ncbi:MAG: hypothetical protein ACK521_03130 [bacterium]
MQGIISYRVFLASEQVNRAVDEQVHFKRREFFQPTDLLYRDKQLIEIQRDVCKTMLNLV